MEQAGLKLRWCPTIGLAHALVHSGIVSPAITMNIGTDSNFAICISLPAIARAVRRDHDWRRVRS
jgi:hypothetical protein